MSSFSIVDALDILYTSIPQWNTRLDELNGQIALRQIELARLEDSEHPRPSTRSLKNKGSTESLRPKDGGENPFANDAEGIPLNPFDTPKSTTNGYSPPRRTSSSIARGLASGKLATNIQPKAHNSTGALERQPSTSKSPTQQVNGGRNVLRKRKTESLASGESIAPKFRTRSMIIIYYDGEVQRAFEDLVKFVSGSRNSMRKGKMAAKMAEMKRAAEKEVEEEEDLDAEDDMLAADNLVVGPKALEPDPLAVGSDEGDEDDDEPMPKLKFVSTRNMGPRNMAKEAATADNQGSTLSLGLLRGYRRGPAESPDIFDQLDKGLEWCQIQCEKGAHNFLREGECGTEIASIKSKLTEVQATALKEMERLKKEEATLGARPVKAPRPDIPKPRGRELKQPQLRREYNPPKELEVDDMEVDDEGVDDLQLPAKLVFKRSGQV
ncbi:hypothetical protein GLAREA_08197 [Glarea lozoyensis ATCC 20868]|uniref:Uncharacterized protein n=2 Tax=Glarea lozoyensis TaxID=101852 RepID=S3CEC9_GLAL2|nr:uncharacterized protein GLAREA_08197 [Glarea lozoyensis ATCC 20868]EPE24345.1 hypothetical protein GLAREA_08197 [Glarea lozoyensis ATCC 20868]